VTAEPVNLATVPSLPLPAADEAHLWLYRLSDIHDQVAENLPLLSVFEREQADRFASAAARHQFVAGRAILRKLLSAYLSTPMVEIEFVIDVGGKPRLAGTSDICSMHFNFAHSGDWVLLGFTSGGEIGVDIERHRPVSHWQGIAERYYSYRELAALRTTSGDSQQELFFRLWTRKEAVLKWHGTGLQTPLSSIEVPIDPQCSIWVELPQSGQRCWLQNIVAPCGYSAAIATSHAITHLVHRSVGLPFLPNVQ
jgi:4'-phosphopantetheinyl transferase